MRTILAPFSQHILVFLSCLSLGRAYPVRSPSPPRGISETTSSHHLIHSSSPPSTAFDEVESSGRTSSVDIDQQALPGQHSMMDTLTRSGKVEAAASSSAAGTKKDAGGKKGWSYIYTDELLETAKKYTASKPGVRRLREDYSEEQYQGHISVRRKLKQRIYLHDRGENIQERIKELKEAHRNMPTIVQGYMSDINPHPPGSEESKLWKKRLPGRLLSRKYRLNARLSSQGIFIKPKQIHEPKQISMPKQRGAPKAGRRGALSDDNPSPEVKESGARLRERTAKPRQKAIAEASGGTPSETVKRPLLPALPPVWGGKKRRTG